MRKRRRMRKRNFISLVRTWWRSEMLWFSWFKASSDSCRHFPLKKHHRVPATAPKYLLTTIITATLYLTAGLCLHIWPVCFSLQIFSKLLYFEPAIGELTFAAGQWVEVVFVFFLCVFENVSRRQESWRLSLFLHREITKLKSIPEMAFYGLQLLYSPKHGDQKEVLSKPLTQRSNEQSCSTAG